VPRITDVQSAPAASTQATVEASQGLEALAVAKANRRRRAWPRRCVGASRRAGPLAVRTTARTLRSRRRRRAIALSS
jgi:hypothetical protein